MLHLEHGIVRYRNLDISQSRSEIHWKFWNLLLQKDAENQLDPSCEKGGGTHSVKDRNILPTITMIKATWVGHIFRRNCLIKHIIEGKLEAVEERQGRRRKQLRNDLKEARWYGKSKEEAQALTLWRTRFGKGCGPVVGQTTRWWESQESYKCGELTSLTDWVLNTSRYSRLLTNY
jgi:hypothetical protein